MQKRVSLERVKAKPWAVDAAFTDERGLFAFHGDCDKPFELYVRGLPDKLLVGMGMEPETPVVGSLLARCRKCGPCLEHRSRLWAARACTEIALAPGRTWFGTLTLNPERQFLALVQARSAAAKSAVDWDELDEGERFRRVDRVIAAEIQKFLKRIRTNSEATLRYLVVCEQHKSGLPHYHCLVHEAVGRVSNRQLAAAWRWGFSKFKLVPPGDPQHAFYVAKYLAKSALARVRASARYGTGGLKPAPVTSGSECPTSLRVEDDDPPSQGGG